MVTHGGLEADDGERTAYPDLEYLSTDAVLPWIRTELVEFQKDAARAMFEALRRRGAIGALLCLPEGAGKVRTALDFALGAYVARKSRVLWIGGRRELLDQLHDEIRELAWLVGLLGDKRQTFSVSRYGSQHRDLSGDVVLASPHALYEDGVGLADLEASGAVSLICIDDARMLADDQVSQVMVRLWSESARVFGLTGTPLKPREAGIERLQRMFGDAPSFEMSFRDLVESRFLSRPVFVRKKLSSTRELCLDPAELQLLPHGDIPIPLLHALIRQPSRTQEILGHWMDNRKRYGKTLIFAYDTEHAEAMTTWLNGHGVASDSVHPGITPEVRQQRLTRFRKGQSEVLVRAGLMTEGEHVPDVQTVVIARPTVSPALYKQMIGWGARRPPVIQGKTHFFVVDCVDELESYGIALAGRSAAVDLGMDFQDTTTDLVTVDTLERRKRRDRALISARAWQILRRLADDQYTVWGELVWNLPEGGEKSVVVFHEGVAGLRPALDAVVAALASGDVAPLRQMGAELDWIGAVRDVDWQEMLSDCAQTGKPPRIEQVESMVISDTAEAAGRVIALLVEDVLSNRTSLAAVVQNCDALLAESDVLRAQFPNPKDLRQELIKLYNDAMSRFEQAETPQVSDREQVTKAFIGFAVAMAMADNVLHESEARTIEKAAARMFELTSDEQRDWVYVAVEHFRAQPMEVGEAAETLLKVATRAEVLHMYDWLFRVAFADGVFAEEEEDFLRVSAGHLQIPDEEFEELAERYTASLWKSGPPSSLAPPPPTSEPAPVPLVQLRYCTACSYPRQVGATFCVACGAELRTNTVQ